MKNILFILLLLIFSIFSYAQVPAGFNYQAVVRNGSGEIIANQTVKFKFSVLQNSATGTAVYVETQSETTNDFGLATLVIGKGSKVTGDLDPSGWATHTHFLKVEFDPANGNSFRHLGTTQLMSVPYAFHAKTVEEDEVNDADNNPENELQDLELSGTVLGLSGSPKTVNLPSSGGGDDWGSQTVETDVTLDGKGTSASPLKIAQQGATSGQVLKWSGSNWIPAKDENDGLTLPYEGTTETTEMYSSAFKVSNSGSNQVHAIYGHATSTTNSAMGIVGRSDAYDGKGVYGLATNSNGITYGVVGSAQSTKAYGVFGSASSATGTTYGVYGASYSNEGYGVYGKSKVGVYGKSAFSSGVGVYGEGDIAFRGITSKDQGYGIYVNCSHETSVTRAVYASVASNTGYSGYFAGGRFYIGGNVGIGTVAPGSKLHIKQTGNGFQNGLRLERPDNTNWWSIQINNYNDLVFDYNGSNTRAWIEHGTAEYHYVSDRRLKTDIIPIKTALCKVLQLNPVTFRFKSNPDSENSKYGLIAQEVEKIYPEFVSENNGNLGIAYHNFSVVNIKAIQEQQEQIGLMGKQIENLVNQNNELKIENDRLKTENKQIVSRLEKLETIVAATAHKNK